MNRIKSYDTFLFESINDLNPSIKDERGYYDRDENIHDEVNHLYKLATDVMTSKGLTVKSATLSSGNKYDGYQIRIKTDKINEEMVLNVSFGKVGMEDHVTGKIDIRFRREQIIVSKNSKGFGDVHIDVKEQEKEIISALKSVS